MADSTNRGLAARPEFALLGAAVLAILVALASLLLSQSSRERHDRWLDASAELRDQMRSLGIQAENVSLGVAPNFVQMQGFVTTGKQQIEALRNGNAEIEVEPLGVTLQGDLQTLEQSWAQLQSTFATLTAGQAGYYASSAASAAIESALPALSRQYEQLSERLSTRGAPAAQLNLIAEQRLRLERIRSDLHAVDRLSDARPAAVDALQAQTAAFARGNASLLESPGFARDGTIDSLLRQAGDNFNAIAGQAAAIKTNAEAVGKIRDAALQLMPRCAAVIEQTQQLDRAIRKVGPGGISTVLVYVAGALAILLLGLFVLVTLRTARERQRLAEQHDQRQQGAILGLLDDITNLADGDLTVDVTVTEDFTGAIADSINYTVDTLRRLVGTINNTSVDIAAAASSTQDTAQRMSHASDRQTREIALITNAVTQTSESLTQVAARAEQLAQDATNSVQVAHNGAATVGRTIQGMAALREQIQDTAKRIKRLGESSQEIGNIIEFINDIAEQTNTLALNASIQAAMAGEAGRGFAVVADEVQRLAERAASATRQVENLVKTIQADTNEAIISMERSTANVVAGASSAEEAGQALTKIESTSTDLARLIQDISASARSQSANASKIAGQMQVIREIAVQTSGSAGQTAQAVGELTSLSEKLRESVAGFKLPADISFTATGVHQQSDF